MIFVNKEFGKIESAIKNSNIVENIKSVSLLTKGGFSDCYLLKTDNKLYVLKIRRDDKVERLEREYKLLSQKKILKSNLAPQIFKFDKSYRNFKYPYLLEEFLVGKHPKKTEVNSWFIKAMAKWYRELHSIKSKKLEQNEVRRINSTLYLIQEEYGKFKRLKSHLDNYTLISVEKLYHALMKICRKYNGIFERDIYDFIQGDPSKENVFILKDKSIKLVDWDFSGYHIFERDLVLFIDIYSLNKTQELMFLKSYGINPDDDFMKKLNILKLLLFAGDINWLLSQKDKNLKKAKSISKKCVKLISRLRVLESR